MMINTEKAVQCRIKRANTDWWINEKSVVGANGMTYICYVTDMGEIHIKEIDAKCSKTPSRDYCICRLNCDYADEHNAPSLCILQSGKIIVAYTGHATNYALYYRVTQRPYDISSFGEEHILRYDSSVTYVQLFENIKKREVWLFTRVNGVTWEFRYSQDEGESWSVPRTFLASDAGGLFYLNIRKQYVSDRAGVKEQWFFALYGHPRLSSDHVIRSGIFDDDGWLLTMDKERTELNLYEVQGTQKLMNLKELSSVYESPEGTTVRLLEVSPTLPLRVGLASFVYGNKASVVYYSASYKDGKWRLSAPIAAAGDFLAPMQTDGAETYVGGMAYYYGVGEAGLHPAHGGEINSNRVFIARSSKDGWRLESYVSRDCGEKYELEQVIRKLPAESEEKIWRPIVPIHAQDNLPVYWHEGIYYAHTGGWHCDAVMFVEYDD